MVAFPFLFCYKTAASRTVNTPRVSMCGTTGTREVPGDRPRVPSLRHGLSQLNSPAHRLHRTAERMCGRLCCGPGRSAGGGHLVSLTGHDAQRLERSRQGPRGHSGAVTSSAQKHCLLMPSGKGRRGPGCHREASRSLSAVGFWFSLLLSRPGNLYFLLAILLFLVASIS